MLFYLILSFCAFSMIILTINAHKIQVLLTHPRTVSSAFEKAMLARADHKIFHEPWVSSYLYHNGDAWIFSQPPSQEIMQARNYQEVKQLIYSYADKQPVFIKDMIWSMKEELLNDDTFLSDPNVVITFLIREPALSIESYFLKGEELMSLKETVGCIKDMYCYETMWDIAKKYYQIRGEWPLIVEAEELCADPENVLKGYCDRAGIEYLPEMLVWTD